MGINCVKARVVILYLRIANGKVLFWALETFAVLDLQFLWSLQRWK
jgi:hypothetical protein